MRDVTNILLLYRKATRHLWNTYFVGNVKSLHECGPLCKYEEIDRLLFSALVLEKIGKTFPNEKKFIFRQNPIPFFMVTPRGQNKSLTMLISDSSVESYTKWNEAKKFEAVAQAEFYFIEFFDWDRYNYVNYPYYRVHIKKFPKYPHLENSDALIKTINASVIFK
ncbi:MAG: hypothetical protein PHQ96_00810 [Candidatus Omnitrophica bacterium]|nr:hypothetical protein [Candidatus Omnitrophota bacterium]